MKIRHKILIPLVVFFLLLVAGISIFLTISINNILVTEEFIRLTESVEKDIRRILSPKDFVDALSPASYEQFHDLFASVNSSLVARMRVWDKEYRIVFSDLKKEIGFRNSAHADIQKLFREEESFLIVKTKDVNEPTYEGEEKFSDAYIPVRFAGNIAGGIEIHLMNAGTIGEISKRINQVIMSIVAGALVLLIILFGVMYLIVLRPIRNLQDETDAIGKGDFTKPLGLSFAQDEIGALARSFDSMRIHVKSLLENISEERDRSRAIISSMSEGLVIINKEHEIILLNPAAGAFLEIAPEEAVGQDIRTLMKVFKGNMELADAERPISQVLATAAPVVRLLEDNIFFQSRSGRKAPVVIFASPLRGDGITAAVVVFRDVSDEYKLSEARLSFISVSSHQLRTPLTSIKWFSEIMLGGDAGLLTEQQKQFMTYIYQGVLRMIDIVNLLLQIARLEAGRVRIAPIPLDLKKFTGEVVTSLNVPLTEKSQHVFVAAEPDPLPVVLMDHGILWQVVQNLLTNAIRYSPHGGEIEIALTLKKNHVEYAIRDCGIGIPAAQQGRIFEKFFRADNALVAVPEGSGLGLSLVKQLVDGWGGTIWFESEEGRGTTFFFTIPLTGMKAKEGDVVLNVGNTQGTV